MISLAALTTPTPSSPFASTQQMQSPGLRALAQSMHPGLQVWRHVGSAIVSHVQVLLTECEAGSPFEAGRLAASATRAA